MFNTVDGPEKPEKHWSLVVYSSPQWYLVSLVVHSSPQWYLVSVNWDHLFFCIVTKVSHSRPQTSTRLGSTTWSTETHDLCISLWPDYSHTKGPESMTSLLPNPVWSIRSFWTVPLSLLFWNFTYYLLFIFLIVTPGLVFKSLSSRQSRWLKGEDVKGSLSLPLRERGVSS